MERPVSVRYAGINLYECGPWTQGPAVLQTLSILKNFDLAARGHELDPAPPWTEGCLCGTERNPRTGVLEAGSDPRGNRSEVVPAFALAYRRCGPASAA